MEQSAKSIVASIAENETVFSKNPDAFAGFVRKVTKTRVDFHWKLAARGKPSEMTVNKHKVICSRTLLNGKTWYGYTLDPFGEVPYSIQCEAAELLLERFIPTKPIPIPGENVTA